MRRIYNTINWVSFSNTESSNEDGYGGDKDSHMQLRIRTTHFLKRGKVSNTEAAKATHTQVKLKTEETLEKKRKAETLTRIRDNPEKEKKPFCRRKPKKRRNANRREKWDKQTRGLMNR